MKWLATLNLALCFPFLISQTVFSATRYAWLSSPTNGPGTSWSTAFHEIQDAIDAATNANDIVLVGAGVYSTGTRATPGGVLLNRIVVTNAIRIHGVDGYESTIIAGQGPLGDSAVRCAYLSGGALLADFTFSNGFTRATTGDYFLDRSGGGAYAGGAIISNCAVVKNTAYSFGGGIYKGMVTYSTIKANNSTEGYGGGIYGVNIDNSVIAGNYAKYGGGGSATGTLIYCTVASNQSDYAGGGLYGDVASICMVNDNQSDLSGGGTFNARIRQSTIRGNKALGGYGGGCYSGLVYNCIITSNNAYWAGGGTYDGVVSNSTICSNVVTYSGGGTATGTVINCVIFDNEAGSYGGGSANSVMSNCTVVGNSAVSGGGATYLADARNSIFYYNTAPGFPNCQAGTYLYCCTTPDPGGTGNITVAPGFVDLAQRDLHLSTTSMCINVGNNLYAPGGLDRGGNARIRGSVVDIGAYESPYVFINVSVMANGTISPSGRVAVIEFANQIMTITAASGYYVNDVIVDGVSRGGVTMYEFYKVTTNHTISAQSLLLPAGPTNVINASAGFGGTIQPSGAVLVPRGSNQVFTIMANPVFAAINDVKTNGYSIGITNTVTFFNVDTNHTIDVFFSTYADTNGYSVGTFQLNSSNEVVFSWIATNGWAYTLQQTPTLVPAAWSNVPPYVDMIGDGINYIMNDIGTNVSMFYRFKAFAY
ncbi:MAG: choice-of-anchor Q domain-containing protein [Kiritimatiellae bacterium]|nr:choice-of-anchor Q domain-containing protein [Kiritimatiellia bacterium]MDD5519722.1 choice-of-anchor Q domain-containing protein [Kiritimatiellia bacterium]